MNQAPSSSTPLDKTKPSQRRNFVVEDITLDDMKDVQLPPNPSKIHLLFEVAHIANLRFEQAFNNHNRNKTIAAAEEKTDDPLEKIRQRIIDLGGVDTRLVMKNKTVFHSDINQNNNRLSMPFGQIRDWQFLSRDEMKRLNADEAFDVKLIFNSLNLKDKNINTVTSCKFCKWKMPKSSGRVNSIFALKGGWYKDVVSIVGLQKGNVIDIWSFRVNGDICFALFIRT